MSRRSEEVLRALYAKRPQVIKPGLDRIRAAMPFLNEGELATPCVLIGGTNGKGTTAAYLAQMLAATGERVGVFTSPHLELFCERIQVLSLENEPALTDDDLVATHDRLRARIPEPIYEAMSFFEVTTLLGLLAFHERKTTINLLEVGLGGRFDSTNVVEPVLSIITSIGLDHQEFLGDTTALIAFEKAGIMRPGKPLILGGPEAYDAASEKVLVDEAERLGTPILRVGHNRVRVPLPPAWKKLPLFLEDNLKKAAIAFQLLADDPGIDPEKVARLRPLPAMRARFEHIEAKGIECLLDVCHNPAGAEAFAKALAPTIAARGGAKLVGMMTMFADKDCDAVLDRLRAVLGPIHLFPLDSERSWTSERLAARHRDLPWHDTLLAAFTAARGDLQALPPGPLVACGSVHGMGQVLAFLEG